MKRYYQAFSILLFLAMFFPIELSAQNSQIDRIGGPDNWGYTWKDTSEPDGPVFNDEFIEISQTGTVIEDWGDADNSMSPAIGLPFEFHYFQNVVTQVYVCTNGFISFEAQPFSWRNTVLPSNRVPNNSIYLFHQDLHQRNGFVAWQLTDDGNFRIEFSNWGFHDDELAGETVNFQVVLKPNNEFVLLYWGFSEGAPVDRETIGFQNDRYNDGQLISYNNFPDGYPTTPCAIRVTLPEPNAQLSGSISAMGTGEFLEGVTVDFAGDTGVTDQFGNYLVEDLLTRIWVFKASRDHYFTFHSDSISVNAGMNTINAQLRKLRGGTSYYYFEEDPGCFTPGQTNDQWIWGEVVSHPGSTISGTHTWGITPGTLYQNNANDSLYSTSFVMSDSLSYLTYYHYYGYELNWDGYNVQISTDGGVSWTVLNPIGGYDRDEIISLGQPGFTGTHDFWGQVAFDLTGYINQDFQIMFRHGSDGTGRDYGVSIDDVEISASPLTASAFFGLATNPFGVPQAEGPVEAYIAGTGQVVGMCVPDTAGMYVLYLEAGSYDLRYSRIGYQAINIYGIELGIDERCEIDFQLFSPGIQTAIAGFVVQADNPTQTCQEVLITCVQLGQNAVTNDFGYFNMGNWIIGTYDFFVRDNPNGSRGYHGRVFEDVQMTEFAVPIFEMEPILPPLNLTASDGVESVHLEWEPPANHVQVVGDQSGGSGEVNDLSDFIGYKVRVTDEGNNRTILPNLIDDTQFIVPNLIGGETYLFEVSAKYDYSLSYLVWSDPVQGFPTPAAIVEGTVRECTSDGIAISGVQVFVDQEDQPRATTDENGWFSATHIVPGVRSVHFRHPNYWDRSIDNLPLEEGQTIQLSGDSTTILNTGMGASCEEVLIAMTRMDPDLTTSESFDIFATGCGPTQWISVLEMYNRLGEPQDWFYIEGEDHGTLASNDNHEVTITANFDGRQFDEDEYTGQITFDFLHAEEQLVIPVQAEFMIDVNSVGKSLPERYALHTAFPNPFNSSTAIRFDLVRPQHVTLVVIDVLGRVVQTAVEADYKAGYHQVIFDGRNLASGVYFYRIETQEYTNLRQMILLK